MKPSKYVVLRIVRKVLGKASTLSLLFPDTALQILRLKPTLSSFHSLSMAEEKSVARIAVFALYINSDDERSEALRIVNQIREEFDRVLVINTGKN